jgi:hypothetical protein
MCLTNVDIFLQYDQKVSVHLMIALQSSDAQISFDHPILDYWMSHPEKQPSYLQHLRPSNFSTIHVM